MSAKTYLTKLPLFKLSVCLVYNFSARNDIIFLDIFNIGLQKKLKIDIFEFETLAI